MEQIHYNQAEHLRITNIEQFVPGRRYLMVHNRRPGEEDTFAPPSYAEVWAIGTELTSFYALDERSGRTPIVANEHAREERWFFFYVTNVGGYQNHSTATDHGFTDSVQAHSMNYILDLDDLTSRDIEILRVVSPGTDMRWDYPRHDYDDKYDPAYL